MRAERGGNGLYNLFCRISHEVKLCLRLEMGEPVPGIWFNSCNHCDTGSSYSSPVKLPHIPTQLCGIIASAKESHEMAANAIVDPPPCFTVHSRHRPVSTAGKTIRMQKRVTETFFFSFSHYFCFLYQVTHCMFVRQHWRKVFSKGHPHYQYQYHQYWLFKGKAI